ncbi:hypothetical protein [Lysobacter soli]|uniref:hypothetical protein n=1 Tax=Lysobacter soli TaxID=453783 RepID=UPI0024107AF2|nr:hypothetical protein [Lysobacter soli]MDG2518891.1 hypothetical protein [Lysobacter soli]
MSNTRASPPHCTMPSTALVARQRLSLPAPPVSSLHTIRLSSLCDAPKCVLSRASNLEIPRNDCTSHESLDEITQRKSQSET